MTEVLTLEDHVRFMAECDPARSWNHPDSLTDYRNPGYHQASDTADTLDYEKTEQVVEGVHAAILHLVEHGLRGIR